MRAFFVAFCSLAALAGCSPAKGPEVDATAEPAVAVTPKPPASKVDAPTPKEIPDLAVHGGGRNVGYHNPKTGYSAEYILDVEWSGDQVERINFDNGGWEDDFVGQSDNEDGTVTVTDEDGREFTVTKEDDDGSGTEDEDDGDGIGEE